MTAECVNKRLLANVFDFKLSKEKIMMYVCSVTNFDHLSPYLRIKGYTVLLTYPDNRVIMLTFIYLADFFVHSNIYIRYNPCHSRSRFWETGSRSMFPLMIRWQTYRIVIFYFIHLFMWIFFQIMQSNITFSIKCRHTYCIHTCRFGNRTCKTGWDPYNNAVFRSAILAIYNVRFMQIDYRPNRRSHSL